MYLVTLQQQIVGTDPVLLPKKQFHFKDTKELADWCHAFIRFSASKGWLKEEADSRFLDAFLLPLPLLQDIIRHGLERRMTLRNKDSHKELKIEIEHLEPMLASHAFHHLTK